MANSYYSPVTPSNYKSPLSAAENYEFVSAKSIFPYEIDPPYGTYYYQKVELNGNKIFENEFVYFPPSTGNSNIGSNIGFTTILNPGTYTVTYQLWDYSNGKPTYKYNGVVYTFVVVENQLPLKKWTITSVINRLLDVCEPIRQGEKPRFRLQGMNKEIGRASCRERV